MGVAYSTIEAFSPPEAMEAFLSERIIAPLLPSVRVKKVKKAREGRRYEIPRVLWNVYEATLEMADGEETQRLFWTKAYFADQDREHYQTRIQSLLDRHAAWQFQVGAVAEESGVQRDERLLLVGGVAAEMGFEPLRLPR